MNFPVIREGVSWYKVKFAQGCHSWWDGMEGESKGWERGSCASGVSLCYRYHQRWLCPWPEMKLGDKNSLQVVKKSNPKLVSLPPEMNIY